MDSLDYHNDLGWFEYCISKATVFLRGSKYARRHKADGMVSDSLNPSHLDSDLWRNQPYSKCKMLGSFFLHDPIDRAYTELFAGLSPEVTLAKSGGWIVS